MASTPAFASAPVLGVGAVSVANTNRNGSGTIVDVTSTVAPTAGRRIERIVVAATADPADGIVTIFLNDGTTNFYYDEFDTADPAAASAIVSPYRAERVYRDLVLPAGWKLRAACTVAPTSGVFNVFAHGGDLT